MTIYLVRHGEAAASWQQNKDPGLSEKGRAQAEALLDFFAGREIQLIHTSPLLRARETALPLSQKWGLPATPADAFREIPTPPDIAMQNRLAWLQRCAHQPWAEADEVVLEWRARLLNALSQLPDHTVVFSHFMVLNAVAGHFTESPELVSYQPDYCSVLSLEYSTDSLCLLEKGREAPSRVL